MSEDLACTLAIIVAFVMGYWNGWVWRYLVNRRRRSGVVRGDHLDGEAGS